MDTRRWFVPIAGMLTGTAWLALWLWEQSPYGRYLDHPRWTEIGMGAAICRALPAGDVILPLVLYAGGWLLMTAAMMSRQPCRCSAALSASSTLGPIAGG